MKLLALDLATRTGWCRGDAGSPVSTGTLRLPSTGKDVGRFLNTYRAWLERTLTGDGFDLVVFESPILRSGQTQIATLRKLYGLAGVTEMVCGAHDVPCREVSIATVKKMLAGHGRAEKAEMIAAARSRGVEVEDDNQADAFGIFLCAVSRWKPAALSVYATKGALL